MRKNKKGFTISGAISALFGLCCALVLGGMFYAAMVYQLAGNDALQPAVRTLDTPAPLVQGQSAESLFPGALLALEGMQPVSETVQDVPAGGVVCRVVVRVYQTEDGAQAEAVSAYPEVYLERLAQEGFEPQLITGFTLAGLDAVYALSGSRCVLYAREGGCAYLLFAPADEQAAYALGAMACLEE